VHALAAATLAHVLKDLNAEREPHADAAETSR